MRNERRPIVRSFYPGQRWLYLKVYGGVSACDQALVDTIYPVVRSLLRNKMISRWFFVRYSDPDFHLRVRVELADQNMMGEVLQLLNKKLLPLCIQRKLHKTVIDTYERELERYGVQMMDLTETLFCIDSHCICQMLTALHITEQPAMRWQMAFTWVDMTLDAFGHGLQQKWEVMKRMSKGYLQEFGYNEHNIKSLASRYRQLRPNIVQLLGQQSYDTKMVVVLKNNKKLLMEAVENVDINRLNITSLLHMSMNRLFATQNRANELVLYYCLEKHYTSELKKRK